MILGFPLNRACMMRSVIFVIDIRFWSSEYFTATPKPPTAAPCRFRVADVVNIVDQPISIALIYGSTCRWTCLCC